MYYDPRQNVAPPPLSSNPINALVAPRPIGWISTVDAAGRVNLAPFSYYNAVSADPAVVVFAPNEAAQGTPKDTLRNVREVGEFVVNLAHASLRHQINATSRVYPHGVNELELVGLTAVGSRAVRPPRVGECKAALECTVHDVIELPHRPGGRRSHLVIGTVVGIFIADELIVAGRVDVVRLNQLARLGYTDYTAVESTFELARPD
jgi:flavin reductase (DIM6/NTAB) family NADH-FMN oxidoreductase RutF